MSESVGSRSRGPTRCRGGASGALSGSSATGLLVVVALCVSLLASCRPSTGSGRERSPAAGSTTSSTAPAAAPRPAPEPSPGDRDERLSRVLALFGAGDFGGGRELVEQVLAEHPGSWRARFLLGLSYHKERRYDLAARIFTEVVESDARFIGHETVEHFRGWALYHLGRLDESRDALERHVRLQPGVADSWLALGLIALEEDRLEAAEAHLRRAIELDIVDPRRARSVAKARARLADVLARRERWEEARAELEQAIAAWPEHFSAHYKLSRVLARLGDEDGAARELEAHRRIRDRDEGGDR